MPNNLFRVLVLALAMLGFFAYFSVSAHAGINKWTSIGPVNESISALAIDPLNPTTLYIATASGIFKSTNGGTSWQAANTGLTSISVNAIAINPVNPTTLYASGYATGTQSAIFKSTNGATSWQTVTTGLYLSYAFTIAIDPINPMILYVGTDFGGIFKSSNAGASWQTLNWNGVPSPIVSGVNALAIDPVNTTTLYARTGEGVFKSTDAGASWQAINTGISALAIDPVNPATLYVGTDNGVFKSTDSGDHWQDTNAHAAFVHTLAIDPITPTTVYAGTFGGGVFKSTDSGGHWQQVNRGLTNTFVRTLAIDPVTPSTVYAGTDNGVFKITFTETPESSPNVVLLLHGMNSNPGTWNDVVAQYFPNANCPRIYDGKIDSTAKPNPQQAYCYRIKFGAFDWESTDKGLENAWDYGEDNGYGSAGDYSSFDKLGTEVDKAITAIRKERSNAKILLVAHSRGGLAARAFLQQPVLSENKSSVLGLITTGTPHNGTRLGRIYDYIKTYLLNTDGTRKKSNIINSDGDEWIDNDWKVIDFLRKSEKCDLFIESKFLDARRPVIGDLRDHSPMIISLIDNANLLPNIHYGELIYDGVHLGELDRAYNLFNELGPDICGQVSRKAEAFTKGVIGGKPAPSTDYLGDGIVIAGSQGATFYPNFPNNIRRVKIVYNNLFVILHTEEPQQTAHIADIACQLGFSLLNGCPTIAQASTTKQAKAPFKPVEIVSHDYDALVALTTEQLWQDWLAVITNDTQANPREQLGVALGIKLRSSDNAAFYVDIQQRLLNTNAPQLERARLAKLLAEIATSSAFEILTDALLNPESSAIQTALSNAILAVADSLPEQPRRADLSAVLETAWTLPKQNQQQHITLALALAKLGTPRGVEVLLAAVDKIGATLPSAKKKPLNSVQKQAIAAFRAMNEIINPDSETVLSRAFMSHRATEAVFIAAGNGLVNLGRDDAAQRVLQRLNDLPDDAVPVGQQWLSHLSGKIDKAALHNMSKTVGLPKQRLLRQQMEEMVQ